MTRLSQVVIKTVSGCDLPFSKPFPVNDLGPLAWCTGYMFEMNYMKQTVEIVQTKYMGKIVERVEVKRTSPHPACVSVKLRAGEEEKNWPYRKAVGNPMRVAAMTRPDIATSVCDVAEHMHAPTEEH